MENCIEDKEDPVESASTSDGSYGLMVNLNPKLYDH